MKAIVNINGVDEVVNVSVYREGSSRYAEVTLENEHINHSIDLLVSGGNDEYGFNLTAEELILYLEQPLKI